MDKRNIKHFGETFEYLKNPELRTQETQDISLIISDAEFSGVQFQGVVWRNINFVNCDFLGSYELILKAIENCTFVDCRFVGIIGLGTMTKVHFLRCQVQGRQSMIASQVGSTEVVYEACEFQSLDEDRNYWGGAGAKGEVSFIRCKAKCFSLQAYTKLTMIDCDMEDVDLWTDSIALNGEDRDFLEVDIRGGKFKGLFNMRSHDLISFTLRDTRFENIDLTGADIRGDVTIERVNGGVINVIIKEGANNLIVRDSKFVGEEEDSGFYAGAFKTVLVENCSFNIGSFTKPAAIIGGGYEIDDATPQPVMTQSMTLRNIKTRFIRSAGLNAGLFRIEGCEFDIAELFESKIDRLEIDTTTIHHRLDLTRTQAREQNIRLSRPSGISPRLDVLDGSNIRMPY